MSNLSNFFKLAVCVLLTIGGTLANAAPSVPTASDIARDTAVNAAANSRRQLDSKRLIHQDINSKLDVPPVFQRPLGVDAGERIHVSQFIVKGVIDHPLFNINQTIVDEYVESIRIEIQNLNSMNEFGLSEEDMQAMGKQLQETLYEDDETALIQHAKLLKKIRQEKRYREEMSIGQLQEVANKLTDFYRQRGLVIAQVFVPEQTIEKGVVTLDVLEGILGTTIVENNKDYSTELLKSPFSKLEHKFVTKSGLENGLFVLSDFPGLIAYGVLQPGVEQGETDLLIKVQEEVKHAYTARIDNYGTSTTGSVRLLYAYKQNNPFGNGDLFGVNLLQSLSPANSLFGSLDYTSPVGFSNYSYSLNLSSNTFDVGGVAAATNTNGTVKSIAFGLGKQLQRSRRANSTLNINFENKVAKTFSTAPTLTDGVSAFGLTYTFDNLDIVNQGINQGSAKLTIGLSDFLGSLDKNGTSGSRTGASGDFLKLSWSYARLQLINKFQNLLIKTEGQYTGDEVPPVEQFGMGGPTNVRAFSTSQFLADTAMYAAIDWNFNAPGFYDEPAFDTYKWGEILQFSAFFDFAIGTINNPRATDITPLKIGGVGVAAQIVIPGKMTVRLDVSVPVLNDSTDSDEFQFYLTFSYSG